MDYKRTKSIRAINQEKCEKSLDEQISKDSSKLLKKQWIDKKKNIFVWIPVDKELVD